MCKRGLSTASLEIPWLKIKSATLPRDRRRQGSARGGASNFNEDLVLKEKKNGDSGCGEDDDYDKRSHLT